MIDLPPLRPSSILTGSIILLKRDNIKKTSKTHSLFGTCLCSNLEGVYKNLLMENILIVNFGAVTT